MIYKPFPDNDITNEEKLYIAEAQTFLRALELNDKGVSNVPIDGIYDTATADAVEAFQRKYALPPTRILDRVTFQKLAEEYRKMQASDVTTVSIESFPLTAGYILREGDANDTVFFLNIMLNRLGDIFDNIPQPAANAAYSEDTVNAVRILQTIAGLPVTGVTNRQTWNAVTQLYNALITEPA